MQIIVMGKEQEVKVTSVILEADFQTPHVMKMFFCLNCGKSLIRYSGDVVKLFPGETPAKIPLLVFCKICKHQYLFNYVV